MVKSKASLKKRFLELLKEDEEFRLAVAGLLGFDVLLKGIGESLQELVRLRQDMQEAFKRHNEEFARIWSEIFKLHEDMIAGFKRHDEELVRVWGEIAKLREELVAGFKRHDEELTRLWREVAKLREDFNMGFDRLNRRLDALGARWGIMAESAFREGLRTLLKDLGLEVEKWSAYDAEGKVHGYASIVEIDVALKDGQVILVEVASHVKQSDVSLFKRKAEFYAEKTGRKPDKLIIVSPYVEENALKAAEQLGIELCTNI